MPNNKVVIVEDEKLLSDAYKERLSREGWQPIISSNAESGYENIVKNKPSLIILDILLPGKETGFELLHKIHQNEELNSIPVIMLTNLQNQEEKARKFGAVACLVKSNTSLEQIIDIIKMYSPLKE